MAKRDDGLEECDSCGYPGVELRTYDMRGGMAKDWTKASLCMICSSTSIGTAYEFHKPSHEILSAIGWIANHLSIGLRK